MVNELTYAEAERALRRGEIDGFHWGYVVRAKKDSYAVKGKQRMLIPRGTYAVTVTDSRAWYGTMVGRTRWSIRKKDFSVADRVVHEVW